ncbi:FimV/HubP family polar landmark protein [Candidatus Albibeggiatoa sp. nov. BB20]|uniref:FimV/HubP family polar landmark protein n=1 Tax=Candidatus Albibeggiatoa sp. nov. BB20 TaxID=3162723 RepID=UPI0033655CC3
MYLPKVILLMVLFLYLPLSHADQTYGPLRNGETLWTIAPKVKPSDTITRHQMIVALLNANPHAFRMSCNINSLKIKQTLTVPTQAEIEKITHKEALVTYSKQNAAWKAFRKQGVKIQCAPIPETTTETTEESSNNTLVAMNTQSAKDVVVVDEVVSLPKLSPPIEEPAEVSTTSPENEMEKPEPKPTELRASQLTDDAEKKINYLPVIIVLGVVFFVLILAFLFRDHSENKPIPEDLT